MSEIELPDCLRFDKNSTGTFGTSGRNEKGAKIQELALHYEVKR